MRKSKREYHRVLSQLCAESNAHNIQFPREAFGDASHRVGGQGSREAVKGSLGTAVVLTDGEKFFFLLLELDTRRNRIGNASLWTRHHDAAGLNIYLHLIGKRNWFFTDT